MSCSALLNIENYAESYLEEITIYPLDSEYDLIQLALIMEALAPVGVKPANVSQKHRANIALFHILTNKIY